MASLIEELIITLKQENEIYQNLIPIEREKGQIIIDNNLEALSEITKKEQEFISEINKLEKLREGAVNNIGIVLSRNSKDLTVSLIIEMLEGQEEQKELAKVYDELQSTLTDVVAINNRNKVLIEQSLDMIQFNMNFYQSIQTMKNNNYDKGAHSSNGSQDSGIFDAKQ